MTKFRFQVIVAVIVVIEALILGTCCYLQGYDNGVQSMTHPADSWPEVNKALTPEQK